MKILAIGDIVGTKTLTYLSERLWKYRSEKKIDFVVANGENASEIRGISSQDADFLLSSGVDFITLGNHAFGKKDLYPMLENDGRIIRPANFPPSAPGMGYGIVDCCGYRLLCINVCGTAFMEAFSNPFTVVENILARENGNFDFALMDIHAEATSEKLALAKYFDGKIQIIFGTHTHVTTADEQILPNGSFYQTDLGMSGPVDGILGTDASAVINKFRTMLPSPFAVAQGNIQIHATIISLSSPTKIESFERVAF